MTLQMLVDQHGSDAGYITISGLLLGSLLNPILHAVVHKSVRRFSRNIVGNICGKHCCIIQVTSLHVTTWPTYVRTTCVPFA